MARRLAAMAACLFIAGCGNPGGLTPVAPVLGMAAGRPATATIPTEVSEFQIAKPVPNAVPFQIAVGSDGAMWFTETARNAIGRIDATGKVREFALPSANAHPAGIAPGSDGALYFAESQGPSQYATHVGRITTSGAIHEWRDDNYAPTGVAAGPAGEMWFTQFCGGRLAIVGKSGIVRQVPLPSSSGQGLAIARGPDGAMWFTNDGTMSIGRVDAGGNVSTYRGLFYQKKYNDLANGVAAGPDGNLWWTALASNAIWATDVRGKIVHVYKVPTPASAPWGIALGKDGALWFTESSANKIGRVTTDGRFSERSLPTANAHPQGIAQGPGGSMWFVESGANQIGRIKE